MMIPILEHFPFHVYITVLRVQDTEYGLPPEPPETIKRKEVE